MKRSRLFLGLLSGLLAVAGAVASKAARGCIIHAYYITAGASQTCVQAMAACNRVTATTLPICMTENGSGYYYTQRTNIHNKKCVAASFLHYTCL